MSDGHKGRCRDGDRPNQGVVLQIQDIDPAAGIALGTVEVRAVIGHAPNLGHTGNRKLLDKGPVHLELPKELATERGCEDEVPVGGDPTLRRRCCRETEENVPHRTVTGLYRNDRTHDKDRHHCRQHRLLHAAPPGYH